MQALRMYRKNAGYTIEGLAEASGVAIPTIWKSEKGVNSPSVRTLERIVKPLGVTAAELLYAEEVLQSKAKVEGYALTA